MSPPTIDSSLNPVEKKILERRTRWQWNKRLLWVSILVSGGILLGAIASYTYFSSKTAETFRERARLAQEEGRFDQQAKWLSRYSMLRPNEESVIVEMALAADQAAEQIDPNSGKSTFSDDDARKYLSIAIGRLPDTSLEKRSDLRKRLIHRLLSLRGPWYVEAKRQVIMLAPESNNAEGLKWMAMALVGQVNESLYTEPSAQEIEQSEGEWEKLALENVGEVVIKAIQHPDNRMDRELLGYLVELSISNPELFDSDNDEGTPEQETLDYRVTELLKVLHENQDSHSILILNRFDFSRQKKSAAEERLKQFAESAIQRLESKQPPPSTNPSQRDRTPQYWDFILVADYANRISKSDPTLSLEFYDRLVSCQVDSVPNSILEITFMRYGELEFEKGNRDKAIEIWSRGLDTIKSVSLGLVSSLAQLEMDQNLKEFASNREQNSSDTLNFSTDYLDRFRSAVKSSAENIATDVSLSRSQRTLMSKEIAAARWRLNILEAMLEYVNGRNQQAIARYELALTDTSVDSSSERATAALQLAALYREQGSWDLAAALLDQAVELNPGEPSLRAEAADAWTRAGNRLRAIEQWRITGNSDSLTLQIYSVEAQYNYLLRLPPSEDRDFGSIKLAIEKIRSHPDYAKAADKGNGDEEILQAIRRLETIELLIPPTGQPVEEFLKSTELSESIGELADKYSDDGELQLYSAERYAAAGNIEKAQEILDGHQESTVVPPKSLGIAYAKLDAEQGNFSKSHDRLVELAKQYPNDKERLLSMAASYAQRGNDIERAYQTLSEIPKSDISLSSLFLIARLAQQLDENSSLVKAANVAPGELSKQWRNVLREKEGQNGSYWRFLDAENLVEELRRRGQRPERNDPLLIEAKALVRELILKRPRWGNAISLQGMISAMEGNTNEAIDLFYQGIASGDERLSTRQQLWTQLTAAGRTDEARKDIRQALGATEQSFDPYSKTLIDLAQREGDFEGSLELARSSAEQLANDFVAQLVHATTATVAAQQETDQGRRKAYLFEAEQAIERAKSVVDKDQVAIAAAGLDLALERGDEDAIRTEIAEIENLSLDLIERLLLMSRGLTGIGDYESALKLLNEADTKLMTDRNQIVKIQRLKADLYAKLDQPDQQISTLREALRSDPTDAQIRSRLAMAIATRDNKDINWDELKLILDSQTIGNNVNRLLYAIILGVHGDHAKQQESISILEKIIKENNSQSDDAARFLAVLLLKKIDAIRADSPEGFGDNPNYEELVVQIRRIYDDLSRKTPNKIVDLIRYTSFLIKYGGKEDKVRAGNLLEQLKSQGERTVDVLNLEIAFLEKFGEKREFADAITAWAGDAIGEGRMETKDVTTIASAYLVKTGFVDEGLRKMKSAYLEDASLFNNYVILLNEANRPAEAMDICVKHYREHSDVAAAVLLIETMLNAPELITPDCRAVVETAVQENKENAPLLESVATLRVQEEDYDKAVVLYLLIDQLDQQETKRIRTLNNLAIAYSEIPGREGLGIEPINRAIKLFGEHPELLDTKCIVLLRSGNGAEAEKVIRAALAKLENTRFQFHLVLAMNMQGKIREAEILFKSLDLKNLDPDELTRRGRQDLAQLKEKFARDNN